MVIRLLGYLACIVQMCYTTITIKIYRWNYYVQHFMYIDKQTNFRRFLNVIRVELLAKKNTRKNIICECFFILKNQMNLFCFSIFNHFFTCVHINFYTAICSLTSFRSIIGYWLSKVFTYNFFQLRRRNIFRFKKIGN